MREVGLDCIHEDFLVFADRFILMQSAEHGGQNVPSD